VNLPDSLPDQVFPCPQCAQPITVPVPTQPIQSEAVPGDASAQARSTPRPDEQNNETILHVGGVDAATGGADDLSFLGPPQASEELGRLDHYRVLKQLGQGGMGMVFLAEDSKLLRRVALKVMKPDMARNPEARQRALREAQVTANIKSDNIVTIFEVGQAGELPFLAMELLEGETLESRLRRQAKLPLAQVLRIAYQTARGLQAAHEQGLIHRDIKPGNIWLEAGTGRVKVLDFGLARPLAAPSSLTQTGLVLGTPAYMSPEQAEGLAAGEKSDLFSFGCLLYQMATGEMPFTGTTALSVLKAVMLKDPTEPRAIDPNIPPALAELILKLMAKDPGNRPASAAEVAEAIRGISLPSANIGPTPMPEKLTASALSGAPSQRPGRRRLFVGAFLAIAAAALAYLFFGAGGVRWLRDRSGGNGSRGSPAAAVGGTVRGVALDSVVWGITAPFTGPSREIGRDLQTGIETCFQQINDNGGVAGRQLKLVPLDDGYEPDRALKNMQALFQEHKVFGTIGNVGTPTAEKTLPYAIDKQMLFFGAFTGAKLLRKDPPDRFVFNVRPSYEEETAAIVRYLVEVRRIAPEQIAVLAQQDGYGDSGFAGVVHAMRKYHRTAEQILRVGYKRNTLEVTEAVETVLRHKEVRAVIMVAVYRPAARFIQRLRDGHFDGVFTNVSFVGSYALAEELTQYGPGYAPGVIVTQVVPPVDSQSKAVTRYRQALQKYFPNERPSFDSLEGYIDSLVLAEGLRLTGENLTTDRLIDAIESIHNLDLGTGAPISFGPSEHQGSHKIWGSVLDRSGRFQVLELE
jgi:ABC-type branched-subunit amino acid transport system substrate-binding protein/predicted Ser/Thr protein kinase